MSGEIENNLCALCLYFGTKFKNEKLEEKCNKVRPKGLKNLLEKSQERNDAFHDFANQNKDQLYIHGSCRSTYIHLISVSSEVNKNKRKNSSGSPVTTSKIKFGSEIPEFDYTNNFIICNQKFDYHSKANLISSVTKKDFATDLCNRIENLDVQTEDTIALKNRLMYDDLVLNNARYYVKCNMSFHDIRPLSINNAGRPLTEEVTKAVEVIFNYIENLEDSQFTSNDLKGLFTNGTKPPNVETIK